MLEDWKKKYKEFCEWQKTPYQVNPMSEEEHICTTCGRHFAGNYCPQCGQSSRIGRYSFKKAFLLFLDVWGLGNRGMFRSIRDLFPPRPGGPITNNNRRKGMASFSPLRLLSPPFALSLLVNTGVNIKGENFIKEQQERFEKDYNTSLEKSKQAAKEEQTADPKQKGIDKKKKNPPLCPPRGKALCKIKNRPPPPRGGAHFCFPVPDRWSAIPTVPALPSYSRHAVFRVLCGTDLYNQSVDNDFYHNGLLRHQCKL